MSAKNVSRREFVKTAFVAAAATAVAIPTIQALAAGQSSGFARAPLAAPAPQSVFPFPINQVTLNSGTTAPFIGNRDRENSYLLFLDDNRMLYNFRVAAGLSTQGAAALGGWDAPDVLLRGHSTGHYLKALAQAYAGGGGSAFLTKINNMVTQLGLCQDQSPAMGYNVGFLAGYPETQFAQLEQLTTYPTIWAPYYTCHKIMAGLLACYQLAGNTQALTIVTKMADWVYGRLSKLTASLRSQMWALYIAGEYGGMNEVMAEIYAITGNPNHLTTATYFDNTNFFNSLSNNSDVLNGMHANQHIPQITGALRVYDQNNNPFYFNVAENFWNMVTTHHVYAYGGTGVGEIFQGVDVIGTKLVNNASESCATYNMLKLTRALFYHNPEAKYMEYYEKGLYNHILANQNQGAAHGPTTYFMPTNPGGTKGYSNDYTNFTCCHGTGMESPTKFQDTIYASAGDNLYVNLFIPSTLNWTAKSMTITQATSFPASNTTQLTIGGSGHIALKIRVPSWVQPGWQATVNGVVQSITATPGSYATIDRTWANGDVVVVTMPMAITIEASPDVANTRVVKYGPIVLCCAWTTATLPTLTASSITSTGTLQWSATVNGVTTTLVPFYTKYSGAYTIYFNITSVGPTNTPTRTNTPGTPTSTPTRTPTATTGPSPTPTNTPPPGAGPVHWYQFEGNASDTGSSPANGTVNGATFVAGKVGQAVDINGGTQYVSLPAGIVSGMTNCTIATWVKLDTSATWRRIFDFGTGTTVNMFLVPTAGTTIRFAITTGGSGAEQRINGTAALPTGVWKHVAVTISGSTGTLYVDGVQVGQNTAMTLNPASLGNTTLNYLGKSQYADPNLDGQLDQFRIYNRALSASEVLALFQTP
jgi:DUF1680 family protein